MPTVLTRGFGYDDNMVVRIIGNAICAELVIEESLIATLDYEDTLNAYLSEEGVDMSGNEIRINMFAQDDRTLTLTLKYPDGGPVDLTDAKCIFTVKEKGSDTDERALFQKKTASAGGSADDFAIIDALGGKAEIYIVPLDTENANPGIYVWDIQVTLQNLKTYTVLRGRISFKEAVTKTRP